VAIGNVAEHVLGIDAVGRRFLQSMRRVRLWELAGEEGGGGKRKGRKNNHDPSSKGPMSLRGVGKFDTRSPIALFVSSRSHGTQTVEE